MIIIAHYFALVVSFSALTLLVGRYTPWAIKKRALFIFLITLANIDGFS